MNKMCTKEEIIQIFMLYIASRINILYDLLYCILPTEENVIICSSDGLYENVTYLFYVIKFLKMVYLYQFVKYELIYDAVMIKYRNPNSQSNYKIFKFQKLSSIIDNHGTYNQSNQSQKPCLNIKLYSNEDTVINLPTDIFRNHDTNNNIIDIISFHLEKKRYQWSKLEIGYIGKKVILNEEELMTATIKNIM